MTAIIEKRKDYGTSCGMSSNENAAKFSFMNLVSSLSLYLQYASM